MKIRQCPHCKSKKGFNIIVFLGGYEERVVSFNGNLIKTVREGTDRIDNYANCLACGKSIDSDKLDLKNV